MSNILLLEDSKLIVAMLSDAMHKQGMNPPIVCDSLAKAKQLMAQTDTPIDIVVSALVLPEDDSKDILAFLNQLKVPRLVLTASFDEKHRQECFQHHVAAVIAKDTPYAIQFTLNAIRYLLQNHRRTVWIANLDFDTQKHLHRCLKPQGFQVHFFESAPQCQQAIENGKAPDMLILGVEAPQAAAHILDAVRQHFDANQLPILSVLNQHQKSLAFKLINHGSNDFLITPFEYEDVYIHLSQIFNLVVSYNQLLDLSRTDDLAQLFNRRHLFETAKTQLIEWQTHNNNPTQTPFVLMMDIDHFKAVNDNYGHLVGDKAIQYTASVIKTAFGQNNLCARFGGEEFCVFGFTDDTQKPIALANQVREHIQQHSKEATGVSFTISIGACLDPMNGDFSTLIKQADDSLYDAKQNGRNQVAFANS